MTTQRLLLAPLAALLTVIAPLTIAAQQSAPVAASAASAASAAVPASAPVGPRLLTPAQQRANAETAVATDLRPDRPVVPQISIPLGRKPAPAASAPARKPPAAP